jgi:Tryptophan synthase beta chain
VIGREIGPEGVILVNLSGRGDKDVDTAARWFGVLEDGMHPDGLPPGGLQSDGLEQQ